MAKKETEKKKKTYAEMTREERYNEAQKNKGDK